MALINSTENYFGFSKTRFDRIFGSKTDFLKNVRDGREILFHLVHSQQKETTKNSLRKIQGLISIKLSDDESVLQRLVDRYLLGDPASNHWCYNFTTHDFNKIPHSSHHKGAIFDYEAILSDRAHAHISLAAKKITFRKEHHQKLSCFLFYCLFENKDAVIVSPTLFQRRIQSILDGKMKSQQQWKKEREALRIIPMTPSQPNASQIPQPIVPSAPVPPNRFRNCLILIINIIKKLFNKLKKHLSCS